VEFGKVLGNVARVVCALPGLLLALRTYIYCLFSVDLILPVAVGTRTPLPAALLGQAVRWRGCHLTAALMLQQGTLTPYLYVLCYAQSVGPSVTSAATPDSW
jgi:hypothetical protein